LKLTRSIAAAALILFALSACHHAQQRKPLVDPELAKLTKEQAFQKGEEQYAKKKYQKARTYFSYVFENFPNDPLGRRALLRVADAYFAQRDAVNLVEAQYKYRDFINRYPGSDRADYAMLQIAMVSYKQMERPDRDTAKTHEALEKFDDVIRAYPKSPLRAEADARRQDVVNRLAKHEHIIARYYMKRGSWNAALLRLNGLIDQYGQYNERDAAFFDLATCLQHLGRKGEARLYYERVVSEYPKSEYASRAKKNLASS